MYEYDYAPAKKVLPFVYTPSIVSLPLLYSRHHSFHPSALLPLFSFKKPNCMKHYVLLVLTAATLYACQKEDVRTSEATGALPAKAQAAVERGLQTRVLNNTLNFPWEILWGPDNFIWFTEREGRVRRMNPQTGQVMEVATIAEVASTTDFNGLLGMALHPQFSTNPFVYLMYNYFGEDDAYLEKVVRYTYDGTTLVSPLTLIDGIIGKIGGDFIHNGSRLVIGPDGKLYVTTGDANLRFELPQNPALLNGKVLRVNLDGSIPPDNPFGNAVWTVGHRNAQGLVFAMGRLYSSEHGETTNDEINIIERGRNYGWPFVEGFCDLPDEQVFCAANNVKEPIITWTPTIAPSGTEFYNHSLIPQWKRSLLVATLKNRRLMELKLDEAGTAVENVHEWFVGEFGRLRDVAISPDGKVYLCTDNGNGGDMIIEVTPKN
jgi:aldose sugar dehydrogenase